jgi:hypothetical protein
MLFFLWRKEKSEKRQTAIRRKLEPETHSASISLGFN